MTTPNPQTSNEPQPDLAPPVQPPGTPPAADPPPSADPPPAAAASKPDGLADEFWDADKGAVKIDELLADRASAQTRLGELESRLAQVPDDPSKYAATADDVKALLPADLKLPDGFELMPDDSPIMQAGKKLAHELGIPAAEFPKLVAFEVQRQVTEANEMAAAAVEQRTLLGEKAPARIAAVENWLKGKIGEDGASTLFPMLFSAKQIEAFEKLISSAGTGPLPGTNGRDTGNPKPTFEGLPPGAAMIHAARAAASGRRA